MPAIILPLIDAAGHWPERGALVGLDLGTQTIGVAVSDPDRRLATGVGTIHRKAFKSKFGYEIPDQPTTWDEIDNLSEYFHAQGVGHANLLGPFWGLSNFYARFASMKAPNTSSAFEGQRRYTVALLAWAALATASTVNRS